MKAAAWRKRVNKLLAEEQEQPFQWHYLSFADEVFRGAVITRARGIGDGVTKCHLLGINPGGEVMCVAMPDEVVAQVPEEFLNRLLSKEEILTMWPDAKPLREWESQ